MINNKKFKNIFITIIICIAIFSLTGCTKKTDDEDLKKEKVSQEIEYLDEKFVTLMNLLNNISFTNYKVVAENVKEESNESSSSNNSASSGKEKSESGSESKSSSGSGSEGSSNEKSNGDSGEEKKQIFKLKEDNILSLDSNTDIKWDVIKQDVENLYSIWATITIDLQSVGVNSNDILQFNTLLDNLAKSVKDQNKEDSLKYLSNLYSLLPTYLEVYSQNTIEISILKTKMNLLNAYCIVDAEDWDQINNEILKANDEFRTIVNSESIDENKKFNVNRAELLLKEMKSEINNKDKELFFLKYKNTLQELDML